ncbi:MAG: cytochrome C biogenesis protein [Spirochaetae bacterium HGW-Spirochaetae-3]|jgi:cytochrome c-type biogenesis protein|nr:MAG: cytochrome C biogenesis protein [Spirochaetae bacterium HGW-Spirochaetae-3]
MTDVPVFAAFGAGLLSFLSPCVLPLIPGYLSFISGAGVEELRIGSRRGGIFFRTLFFVLGFSAVFVGLGLVFSGSGMFVSGRSNRLVTILAGTIIVVLGLNMIFGFMKFLNSEARIHVRARPASAAGAFVVGMAFGAGWTPCIGPILASILLLAARSGGATEAALLLSAYSAGLALPFLAAGLFFERLAPLWAWFKRHGGAVRVASGILLTAIGLTMALGRLTAFNAIAARAGMALTAFVATRPSAATAWTVAILSMTAAAIAIVPALRGRRLATPLRLAVLSVLAIAILLESLGVLSLAGIVSGWLLFQGA